VPRKLRATLNFHAGAAHARLSQSLDSDSSSLSYDYFIKHAILTLAQPSGFQMLCPYLSFAIVVNSN